MVRCAEILKECPEIFETIGMYKRIEVAAHTGAEFHDVPRQLVNLIKIHKYLPQAIIIHVGSGTLKKHTVRFTLTKAKEMLRSVDKLVYHVQRYKQLFAGVFVSLLVQGMNDNNAELMSVNLKLRQYSSNIRAHPISHKDLMFLYANEKTEQMSRQTYIEMLIDFDAAVEKNILNLNIPGPNSKKCRRIGSQIKSKCL